MQISGLISTGTYKESVINWYKPRIVGNAFISDIKLFKRDKFLKDEGFNTLNYFE